MRPGNWRWLSAGLLLFGVLLAGSQWRALESFSSDLQARLVAELPPRLVYAPETWDGRQHTWRTLAERIDRDLAQLRPEPRPGPLRECRAQVLRVQQEHFAAADAGERRLLLRWLRGASEREVELGLRCQRNWAYLLPVNAVLAALATGLLASLPRPPSARRRRYLQTLSGLGCPPREARALSRDIDAFSAGQLQLLDIYLQSPLESWELSPAAAIGRAGSEAVAELSPTERVWLREALAWYRGDAERALAVACADASLVLLPGCATVVAHGVEIRLPTTPFFYYYWYALRRLRDSDTDTDTDTNADSDSGNEAGGWYTNPSSSRADFEGGRELLELMVAHNGHNKAINDLREKGLRAKTLDQNRSKVREVLQNRLGERLAADYLFELERDPRTARFRCRLATAPEAIRVQSERPDVPPAREKSA